jgi:cell division protein FtsN
MTTQSLASIRRRQAGGTLLGLIAGLVLGLSVAVGVALYITKVPAPLVNKVKPPSETINPSANGEMPDPNKPLYGSQRVDPATAPATAAAASTPPDPRTAALPPAPGLMPASASAIARPTDATAPVDTTRFLLQAGAYHSADDADAVRARLAMLGLDAKVVPRDQDGATLYRVRLGPYGRIEDLDKIRQMLATNGIDVQVVTIK